MPQVPRIAKNTMPAACPKRAKAAAMKGEYDTPAFAKD